MTAERTIRIALAALAAAASVGLSWPYWRDFEYWPESHTMWAIYFIVGYILAVYVFYAFLDSLATLFEHDALDREKRAAPRGAASTDPEDAS